MSDAGDLLGISYARFGGWGEDLKGWDADVYGVCGEGRGCGPGTVCAERAGDVVGAQPSAGAGVGCTWTWKLAAGCDRSLSPLWSLDWIEPSDQWSAPWSVLGQACGVRVRVEGVGGQAGH